MGLFTKRYNVHAWGYALFGGESEQLTHPDVKLYARLTEQQITNDCRIILESAAICQKTKERSTFVSRKKGAKGRYEHLQTLVPFADDNQKPLIKQTKKAMMQIERMK